MSYTEYKALLSAVICYNTSYSSKIPVEVFVAGRVKYNKKNGGTKTVKEGRTMRRGFSLIELMFVVAIIVILAAVIIPNFTGITDRSKTARVSEDFSNFATALELYRADWGTFPFPVASATGVKVNDEKEVFFKELTGQGTKNATTNKTITGFQGGIEYVKPATLENLVSPYNPSDTYYYKTDADGHAWVLYVKYVKDGNEKYVWRSDSTSALQTTPTPPTPTP